MESLYGHWNIEIVGEFDPSLFFGFIYIIQNNTTGKKYIGKKFFKSKKKKQVKGKKKSITVESDWKDYISSSEEVKKDIMALGKDNFTFAILQLCSGKCELTYKEEKYQYEYDVLMATYKDGTHKFYNKTIGHKNYSGIKKQHDLSYSNLPKIDIDKKNALLKLLF